MRLDTEQLIRELAEFGVVQIAGDMWYGAWMDHIDYSQDEKPVVFSAYAEGDTLHELLENLYNDALAKYKIWAGKEWDSPFEWENKFEDPDRADQEPDWYVVRAGLAEVGYSEHMGDVYRGLTRLMTALGYKEPNINDYGEIKMPWDEEE